MLKFLCIFYLVLGSVPVLLAEPVLNKTVELRRTEQFSKAKPIDFSCSMPILLTPIIENIRNSNKIENNDLIAPKQCLTQKILFRISRFTPNKTDQSRYNDFLQICYYKLNAEFRLYINNGIVMKIEQINSNKPVAVYRQTIKDKIDKIHFNDSRYEKLSKDTLNKIYAAEPVLLRLNEGNNGAEVTLTVDKDVDTGIVKFENCNFEYRFCCYKGQLENSVLFINNHPNKKIVFSITLTKNVVTLANVYDNEAKNGFDCNFHYNMGLKFYLTMKNGLFNNVFIWSLNGIKRQIYPFDIWEKEGRPMSYKAPE